jgi:ATP-dependent Clp protease protease subunit
MGGISMKKFWQFRAATDKDKKKGELLLYGPIADASWWGDEVTPKQFHEDLKALGDIEVLDIYINSPGGDVFASQAIYSMLARHSATKNVFVDGLAASGASLVAMVGDTVTVYKNAMLMIHNPWTFGWGFASDLRKIADDLDKIREAMIPVYTEKSGLSREEVIKIMDAETWLTGDEALEKGFADQVMDAKEVAASLNGGQATINGQVVDISRFKNFPKDKLAAIAAATQARAEEIAAEQERKQQAEREALERQAKATARNRRLEVVRRRR